MSARLCSVDGCDDRHVARGYCATHYKQQVTRAGAKRRSAPIHIEDVEWMAETGEVWTEAAKRLGVHPKTLERRLARAGRQDLVTTLRTRENGFAYTTTTPTNQGDTAA